MKYYTSREAAERLRLHPNTLRKMSDSGRIHTIRINGQRRYDVDGYLEERKMSSDTSYCPAPRYKRKPQPVVKNWLEFEYRSATKRQETPFKYRW